MPDLARRLPSISEHVPTHLCWSQHRSNAEFIASEFIRFQFGSRLWSVSIQNWSCVSKTICWPSRWSLIRSIKLRTLIGIKAVHNIVEEDERAFFIKWVADARNTANQNCLAVIHWDIVWPVELSYCEKKTSKTTERSWSVSNSSLAHLNLPCFFQEFQRTSWPYRKSGQIVFGRLQGCSDKVFDDCRKLCRNLVGTFVKVCLYIYCINQW